MPDCKLKGWCWTVDVGHWKISSFTQDGSIEVENISHIREMIWKDRVYMEFSHNLSPLIIPRIFCGLVAWMSPPREWKTRYWPRRSSLDSGYRSCVVAVSVDKHVKPPIDGRNGGGLKSYPEFQLTDNLSSLLRCFEDRVVPQAPSLSLKRLDDKLKSLKWKWLLPQVKNYKLSGSGCKWDMKISVCQIYWSEIIFLLQSFSNGVQCLHSEERISHKGALKC